ncbi:SGNH/GDSL hydrolase family protein [Bacillus smithii]|uniref:SGNH/GDSL hydrolase family protein n=1 Tax=Bacillus smithii TaxID=1479 RepID=UPI0030C90082
MKNLMTLLFAVVVALFLLASYWYWKEKTTVDSTAVVTPVSENGSDESWQDLSSHWPDQARKQLEKSFQDGKPFQVAIVGSKALGKENNSWSVQLKKALETAYSPVLKASIWEEEGTSLDFLQHGEIEKIADSKPDMILFEPFTWADNGKVSVEDNHTVIQTFVRDVKAENEHAVVMIQPPNPIYGASNYPEQVKSLKEFAKTEGLNYIDHWKVWPDYSSVKMKDYIDENNGLPNTKGHALWAKFLKKYFMAS